MASLFSFAAVAAGVGSHLFFFKTGERHLYPLRYIQAFLVVFAVLAVAHWHYGGIPVRVALIATTKVASLYLAGLYSSLVVYRLFLNPLNRFPGPYTARFSKFDHVFRNAKLNGHHQLHDLHRKHGRFVRIGPNDLSVTDPDGVQVILGPQSKCTKAQWYSQDSPLSSMHTTRDRVLHDRRRRIWSPAFSDKALRGYENRIQKYNELLIKQIDAFSSQPINASKWFNLYSFDVMGDLGYGQSFNMLESGEAHWAIKVLDAGMNPIGYYFPPWLFRTIIAIPGAAAEYHRFNEFCYKQLDARMKVQGKQENPDITHALIEAFNKLDKSNQKAALPMLQGDSKLIIVAGSDTTATTLVHLFFHLATESGLQQQLRDELTSLIGEDGHIIHQKILDAQFLNGCINETLRLNPPVPSGFFRKTPKEGVYIGDTFIPGDTVVQMPQYAMGHDESSFTRCDEFIPERWFSQPELIKHKDAFHPFSIGPYGCIGKNLAYMEVRLLTAQLVMRFDVALAPGEDGERLLMNSTDHFTMGLAELDLVFTRRK